MLILFFLEDIVLNFLLGIYFFFGCLKFMVIGYRICLVVGLWGRAIEIFVFGKRIEFIVSIIN